MRTYYPVLSISASDSSGATGIQADIKTISALGCYAMTAVTGITAQSTVGVTAMMPATSAIVVSQMEAIFSDIPPLAVKTGMLTSCSVADAVAEALESHRPEKLVVDPEIISPSGTPLLDSEVVDTLVKRIFPLATLVTLHIKEAERLTGETDPSRQARAILASGCSAVLITGCHPDIPEYKTDIFYMAGGAEAIYLRSDAVQTHNTLGAGSTLSSAIASFLALGYPLQRAVSDAKLYVSRALESGAFVTTGRGAGPVNHFFSPRRLKNFNPRFVSRR